MMSLKAKVEAIIYAAEEPVTLEQISALLKDVVLADMAAARENAAIEQADSAAEAAATGTPEAVPVAEPAAESPELITPEPGPLMPQEETESVEAAQPETSTELANPEPGPLMPQEESAPAEATSAEPEPAEAAAVAAPESTSRKRQPKKSEQEIAEDKAVRARVREILGELVTDYSREDRGMEIRQVAGGFRMATKPEHHDVVRAFAKSLKPPIRLSLAALETLAVIAYKQPITGPEIAEIRGVESASVLGTLLDRKLITTAGRKQVIGRPMQYKTSKDFLLRFGLNDVNELPSMEEFSQFASDGALEITPSEPAQTPSLFEPNAEAFDGMEVESETPQLQDAEASDSAEVASPQPDAPEASDSQPHSEAESGNQPEAEDLIGQ
jgi:segregation and condensation protein B